LLTHRQTDRQTNEQSGKNITSLAEVITSAYRAYRKRLKVVI